MSSTPTSVDEVPDMTALREADRCERCAAQAYVRVRLTSGGGLDFCAHHYREHEPGLAQAGAEVVIDQRGELAPNPV